MAENEKDILDMIEEQYGKSEYGFSSVQVYRIVKPKELRGLFLAYHTMDPSQAIERILEAKGLLLDEETEIRRQFEIFKRIRKNVKDDN